MKYWKSWPSKCWRHFALLWTPYVLLSTKLGSTLSIKDKSNLLQIILQQLKTICNVARSWPLVWSLNTEKGDSRMIYHWQLQSSILFLHWSNMVEFLLLCMPSNISLVMMNHTLHNCNSHYSPLLYCCQWKFVLLLRYNKCYYGNWFSQWKSHKFTHIPDKGIEYCRCGKITVLGFSPIEVFLEILSCFLGQKCLFI